MESLSEDIKPVIIFETEQSKVDLPEIGINAPDLRRICLKYFSFMTSGGKWNVPIKRATASRFLQWSCKAQHIFHPEFIVNVGLYIEQSVAEHFCLALPTFSYECFVNEVWYYYFTEVKTIIITYQTTFFNINFSDSHAGYLWVFFISFIHDNFLIR